ncbi:SDR family oxidoreductase [Streptosporangium lutulentum]|uniref:NAD(P)-dependent dehydrogenase (Short-subunit alcohol dehydrogenase family) n=1 Tax=Streptosporangium lutulentum TaxID=1461250 RepID=A0ABT9QF67_9ACTN|nr:SDR family oxidoreductase [Streptosporangium lutulentum]MDP9844584.1 NAD(P)-dependent dehydrogenase (short-subunit alcohol dehydrogenase family) [Streptosporangium lutulentum]
MDIQNAVALVTGANRGLGRHLAEELLKRGARKVYAGVRRPASVDLPGVVPLQMDITDPASVAQAAKGAPDTTLLINNAGISTHVGLIDGDIADIRREMETHFFGSLDVARAFAPVITANGGGAILNILSVLSWVHYPAYGGYSAAKAAELAMTNVIRQELAPAGIDVTALHVGYMDTDMADYVDGSDKVDPAWVASLALDGVQARALEVVADDKSRNARAALSGGLDQLYPGLPAAR